MTPSNSIAFDRSLQSILDHLGISEECRRSLFHRFSIHDFAGLKKRESLLEKVFAQGLNTLSLQSETAGLLLDVLHYVRAFEPPLSPSSEDRVLKGIGTNGNFLFWLTTGILHPFHESMNEGELVDSPDRKVKKPRRLNDLSDHDSLVPIRTQIATGFCSMNKLNREELEALLAQIKNTPWSYDTQRNLFYLQRWPDLTLPAGFFNLLYGYQREGVEWMANRFIQRMGGILADEMGLGTWLPVRDNDCKACPKP